MRVRRGMNGSRIAEPAPGPDSRAGCITAGQAELECGLAKAGELEQFLAQIERRAFRIARLALRNDEDAFDAVQDAMLQLARRYSVKPADEWRPLFYRILQNRVRDYQRRLAVRRRFMGWLPGFAEDAEDPMNAVPDTAGDLTERAMIGETMGALEAALRSLPGRQQEAFMLRVFEGLDVAQTAAAMGCSDGSVKTHYSRAVHTLRQKLGETW